MISLSFIALRRFLLSHDGIRIVRETPNRWLLASPAVEADGSPSTSLDWVVQNLSAVRRYLGY